MKQIFTNTVCKILIIVFLVPILTSCEIVAASGVAGAFAYYLGKKSGQRGDTAVKNEALVEVRQELDEKQKALAATDENITNDINQRLVSGTVDQQLAVYPEVKNGVVILHGRVPDAKSAEKVIQSARQAPGVSRIISNLVVVNQNQSPVPYGVQSQRYGGQMMTPQQAPQQVVPIQPVMQPAVQQPQYPQQYAPQQPIYLHPYYPPQQIQQPQQQAPQIQQQYYQQPQYAPPAMPQGQTNLNQSTEKKNLISADSASDQKKNLKRPANQFLSGYYQDQYGNIYYYPPVNTVQNQPPATLPDKILDYYSDSDNDATYKKYNPLVKKANQPVIDDIPVPTPSAIYDYDEYYRPLGSYSPEGKLQNTVPVIPVPTPALTYDQDEYYRPLGSYNPNPVQHPQSSNFQYVSPAEEPNADALDAPSPNAGGDNDSEYYYFY